MLQFLHNQHSLSVVCNNSLSIQNNKIQIFVYSSAPPTLLESLLKQY